MAAASHGSSHRVYWWWNSHINPKNSKWLQENITDIDGKVKLMIKLIEEDADSFARRAEMLYKKRPELKKLAEDFNRAYHTLANRYDHATVLLRHAHRTMAEAFPNQVPSVITDDSPAGSATEAAAQTSLMPAPVDALFGTDEMKTDGMRLPFTNAASGNKIGALTEESDSVTCGKSLNQLTGVVGSGEPNLEPFPEGRAGKGDAEEKKEEHNQSSAFNVSKAQVFTEFERMEKAEKEILYLKEVLAKLEAEKEEGLSQYQKSLERLSKLESEFSYAQHDSRSFIERASKAEAEVRNLKEAISRVEGERESSLLRYQQCLDKISSLENKVLLVQKDSRELTERTIKAEYAIENLKQEIVILEAEKEAALVQHKQSLLMISELKEKLLFAEEDAKRYQEQAAAAESEVITLKQALKGLNEEKEAAAHQYEECLEKIESLERQILCAQQEAEKLRCELDHGVAMLKAADERCLLLERSNKTLQFELESAAQKLGLQSQEFVEKQKELGRLWTCIQEERLRFAAAETAFQTLQHLHSQSQEEVRSLAAEMHDSTHILKVMETKNQTLESEIQQVKEMNKCLNDANSSSDVLVKDLQYEISGVREKMGKFEAEAGLLFDQRNALQQEICCLKQELNDLNKKNQALVEQVESVGFDTQQFGSSVKELQEENSNLKEIYEISRSEQIILLEKLEALDWKNTLSEKSLSEANTELNTLRVKLKSLEDACLLLEKEKYDLINGKETLISKLSMSRKNLEEELDKANNSQIAIFILEKILQDMQEKSRSLLSNYKELLEASKFSEKLISELEYENLRRQLETSSLVDKIKTGLHAMSRTLDVIPDYQDDSEQGKPVMSISGQLEEVQQSLSELCDENLQLLIEKSVIMELLRNLKLEAADLSMERDELNQNFGMQSRHLSMLQTDIQQLMQLNEEMWSTISHRSHKEEGLITDMENMSREFYSLEAAFKKMVEENQRVLVEKRSLSTELSKMQERKHQLEEENFLMFSEAVLQTQLSQLFKDILWEKIVELKQVTEDLMKIHLLYNDLGEKVRTMEENLRDGQNENFQLKKSLEKSENELLDVEKKLSLIQDENSELCEMVDELTNKYYEVKVSEENQKKIIAKLSRENDCQVEENESLRGLNHKLQDDLQGFCEEFELNKIREGRLRYRLWQKKKDAELWETQTTELFAELQMLNVREVFFEEKTLELIEACKNFEYVNGSKEKNIEALQDEVSYLRDENKVLRTQLSAYVPALLKLKDSITSLEEQTLLRYQPQKVGKRESKHGEICQQKSCDHVIPDFDGSLELQDLQRRIHAVEVAVVRKLNSKAKQDKVRETEHVNSGDGLCRENDQMCSHTTTHMGQDRHRNGPQRPKYEIWESGGEVLTKDITLDQIYRCSSHSVVGRRSTGEADKEMLELWTSTDRERSIDFMVGKAQKVASSSFDSQRFEAVKEQRRFNPSADSLFEKELGVDKLEIPRGSSDLGQESNNRRILERLDSDAQKLTNLQITVHDLKRKVEASGRDRTGESLEYEAAKGQVEEAEALVKKLLGVNRRLMKKVQDDSLSSDGMSEVSLDESGGIRRRRIPEQARRASEKIGRLQLELQRLQLLLLKLDEKETRSRTRITERRPRVILRDYLYGGVRTAQKHRRPTLCGCVQTPSSKGDISS